MDKALEGVWEKLGGILYTFLGVKEKYSFLDVKQLKMMAKLCQF
jgi:hypothetical protein